MGFSSEFMAHLKITTVFGDHGTTSKESGQTKCQNIDQKLRSRTRYARQEFSIELSYHVCTLVSTCNLFDNTKNIMHGKMMGWQLFALIFLSSASWRRRSAFSVGSWSHSTFSSFPPVPYLLVNLPDASPVNFNIHPEKINIELRNWRVVDVFSFSKHVFSDSMVRFRGSRVI